jgi:hypothetical protein
MNSSLHLDGKEFPCTLVNFLNLGQEDNQNWALEMKPDEKQELSSWNDTLHARPVRLHVCLSTSLMHVLNLLLTTEASIVE